jgi:hypothetical protein
VKHDFVGGEADKAANVNFILAHAAGFVNTLCGQKKLVTILALFRKMDIIPDMRKKNDNDDIKKLLTASLDEQQAKAMFAMGEEAVVFALLTLMAEKITLTATLCAALREFVLTGKLPMMERFISNG